MIRKAVVTKQAPPGGSYLAEWYHSADLLDSYAVELPRDYSDDILTIAHSVLDQPKPWFIALLRTRDRVMRTLGLRTSEDIKNSTEENRRIGFFPVVSLEKNEIVLGADDTHLRFRISIMIQQKDDGQRLVFVTTAVQCGNVLGYIYIAAIKPFHRVIARSNLRQAAETGFAKSHPR